MARPDFRAAFGAHPVPQLLDDLGEFAADVKGGYFAGRFKLGPEDATAWLAECFGIQPAKQAARVVKRAAAEHPKLADRYGRRGG